MEDAVPARESMRRYSPRLWHSTMKTLVDITEEAVDRDCKEIFTTKKYTSVNFLPDMCPEIW